MRKLTNKFQISMIKPQTNRKETIMKIPHRQRPIGPSTVCLMILLLALCCAPFSAIAFQGKGSDYDKAKKLLNSGKFDQAITTLNKLADDTTGEKKERKDVFLLLS